MEIDMKKKLIYLVTVFVVALLSGYFWLQWKHQKVLAERAPKAFLTCNKYDISQIELLRRENGGGKRYLFERTDHPKAGLTPETAALSAEWQLTVPEVVEADASLAKMMVQAFCDLYSYQKVENTDLSALGLKEPAVEVVLSAAASKEKNWRVRLSNKVPQSANQKHLVYAAIPNGETWDVYLVPPTARMIFFIPKERFNNRRLVKMQVHDVQLAKVFFQGVERFSIERSGGDWQLISAGKNLGVNEEAGKYINRISTLSAIELLANSGGEKYCTSKPKELEVEVQLVGVADRRETIRFSKPSMQKGKTLMKACSHSRQAIFGVHPEMWKYLDQSSKALAQNAKAQNAK
jgi:hypothetical protein